MRRVASSGTFEKSPRLRAFFLHVCRCALENKPEEATEQQIGIHVYDRSPGYNPNEDNVVRTAARSLRLKLEHHFANEGKDEPVIIDIPKGRYLPVFEPRSERATVPAAAPATAAPTEFIPVEQKKPRTRQIAIFSAVLFGVVAVLLGYLLLWRRTGPPSPDLQSGSLPQTEQYGGEAPSANQAITVAVDDGGIRIAVGRKEPYVDARGRTWEADRYYDGGVVKAGPRHIFPPVVDRDLFSAIRESAPSDTMGPESRGFRYDIPVKPGVYELRLYFADPLRQPDNDQRTAFQNLRHFQVNLNGQALLVNFDPITDSGSSAVDIRAFKNVSPASDGKIHLEFISNLQNLAFVSAIELIPGTPGKLKPIRIVAQRSDFVDAEGTQWSADKYYVDGRLWLYRKPESGPTIPALYIGERHGNFSYAIPVPPGSYTVRLHFLESYFSPLVPSAYCQGAGCRVFDVTCNGVMLLQDFDIFKAASGAFQPVIREFHGVHPNGQGKLLLSFSPKVNYAEVRAIEVIDEGK